MIHVVYQQEKDTCTFYLLLFNKTLIIFFNKKYSRGNTDSLSIHGENFN